MGSEGQSWLTAVFSNSLELLEMTSSLPFWWSDSTASFRGWDPDTQGNVPSWVPLLTSKSPPP